MPGTQLNNYDLVIEFTESAINRIVGAVFDAENFLCNRIFSALSNITHVPISCPTRFVVTVSLGPPTDIAIPGGNTNVMDVHVQLGDNGSIGSLRFVAKVDVNHLNNPDMDMIQIDLSPSGLLYTQISAFGLADTNNLLTQALNQIRLIPLVPIPVNRNSSSPVIIISADVKAIEDSSPQQLDALAILLTFGGGGPGNHNGFTQSFVPTNETGGIGISFDWLCRIIRPQLASALNLPVSDFNSPCSLNTSVPLQGDHNPRLDSLSLTLVNGAIHISAGVSASDTGWSATATVDGSITFDITNGQLTLSTHINDPNIDVSLDWWVYLAAAVVGTIVGGIIGGVIGAIIGAILLPLITWLASNLLNGIINNIAAQIVTALNSMALNVNIPAVGLNIVFQEVHIDDIVIGSEVHSFYQVPIKSEGYLTVYNDQWIDLDDGRVGGHDLSGADLSWEGQVTSSRKLKTLCCSKLARTGSQVFDHTRYELYELNYVNPGVIPESELSFSYGFSLPLIGGQIAQTIPSDFVYCVETSEQRFSIIQVVEIAPSYITLRYRTFEKPISHMGIICNSILTAPFVHDIVGIHIKEETAQFEPSMAKVPIELRSISSTPSQSSISKTTMCEEMAKLGITSPGIWKVPVTINPPKSITFKSIIENFDHSKMHWSINRQKLEGEKGTVKIQDQNVNYSINHNIINLETNSDKEIQFEISVQAYGKNENHLVVSTCVQMPTKSIVYKQAVVAWPIYQKAFAQTFGSMEIPN